ncbi:LysR family transcriptional regulator [Mangrovactinospora gilvigrisea]|uniref:LysR family transcriptional regulator n=1 Tax=Mangrovactinospora gilvigrisea TaxID=1428644 RepID=A0A1J7BLC6_9ACTN|nr:LysR family transcriptional regulator [Mangrovactinospora gilvigrisea]OIV39454.1 LysR family transcriptional regulator [Mangrovactinospora gilvigrisea]
MELRDIEIFLTLAEQLHFARTAERLRITPSRVSHVIKQQERNIGVPLFERTSRAVRLTPAGERLYQHLRPAYRQIMEGIDEVRASGAGAGGTLALGTVGPQSWRVHDRVERFRSRYPGVDLTHRDLSLVDPLTPLRSGEVDVALLWMPMREPDLAIGRVTHTSPVLLMLPADHPYADRESVCLEDFGDLVLVGHRSPIPPAMEEVLQPFATPSGRRIARGPLVATWDDRLKAVSTGQAVATCPAEAARFSPWPDVAYVPVSGLAPLRWAFAWRAADDNPLVRAFVRVASDSV